jgi:hypothetical protein
MPERARGGSNCCRGGLDRKVSQTHYRSRKILKSVDFSSSLYFVSGPLRRDWGFAMNNSFSHPSGTWRSLVRVSRFAALPFRVVSLRYRWFAATAA